MVERRADVRRYMVQRVRAFMLATYRGPLVILNNRDDLEWNVVFGAGLCVIPRTEEEFWRTRDAYAKWRLLGTPERPRDRPPTRAALRRGRQVDMPLLPGANQTTRGGSIETSHAEGDSAPQLASCLNSGGGGTIRDGESVPSGTTAKEPLEDNRPMPSASERVAKALADRKAAAAPQAGPTKTKTKPAVVEDEDDDEDEAPAKTLTVKERAAAARAARSAPKTKAIDPDSPLEDEDEDDDESEDDDLDDDKDTEASGGSDEDDEAEEDEEDEEEEEAPAPKAKAKTAPVKGKKPASPAQIAAREAFAARSRAKAEANRKPVQTEAQVKAKQSADRKAAAEAAAEKANPSRDRTPKPTVVKKALTGNALKAHQAKLAREEAASQREVKRAVASRSKTTAKPAAKAAPAKAPAKAKAAPKAPAKPGSDTKSKVLALWAKGKSRKEIADALDLSYAAVFHHTKGDAAEGGNVSARGRIFVDDPLHKGRGAAEQISRSEAMRRCYTELDMTIGDIARKYGVVYQIAYTAIRPLLLNEDDE